MNKLLTPQEIADLLSVRKSTIYQWTHMGYIPHVKLGKFVRFQLDELLKWLEKKAQNGKLTKRIDINNLISN